MKYVICMVIALSLAQFGFAADYYVACDSSDSNPGSKDRPFRTPARARDAVRESGTLGKESVTVHFSGGRYYLDKPLVLSAKNLTIEQMRKELGQEINSIVADPMFVDPAVGDYRVRPDSPVLKLGFKNFPMEFGVTAPRLVKLLPKRSFPTLECIEPSKESHAGKRSAKEESFMGCTVKNLTEEQEKSAVGIGSITGVLILRLPEGTPLDEAGLSEGDLIIACNGENVDDFSQLASVINKAKGRTIELQVHDDSKVRKYTVKKEE